MAHSKSMLLLLMTTLACANKDTNADETPADETGVEVTEPIICTESSGTENACECSTDEGFATYRFTQGDEERCLTTYVDPPTAGDRRPLVLLPDCYSENALQPHGEVLPLARNYNVRTMELSSPTGGWRFPLDNRVNAENHETQCDPENSPEIAYLQQAFTVVDQMVEDGTVDPDNIYVSGFSQNSMFSVFAATCFPERIKGISQGGSGLYSQADGSLGLPNCEGECTRSDFEALGSECLTETPCDDCDYFPVLPTRSDDGFQSCLFMYDNDNSAHSTAVPGHKLLTAAGQDATLRIFASSPPDGPGGHEMPVLGWEWSNSCLGVNPPCSAGCEEAVVSCMGAFQEAFAAENGGQDPLNIPDARRGLYEEYRNCMRNNAEQCPRGCASTEAMLLSVEVPACECMPGEADCACTTSDIPSQCGMP